MTTSLSDARAQALGRRFATLALAAGAGLPVAPTVCVADATLRTRVTDDLLEAVRRETRAATDTLARNLPRLLAALAEVRAAFSVAASVRAEVELLRSAMPGSIVVVLPSAHDAPGNPATAIESACEAAAAAAAHDVDAAIANVWLSSFSSRAVIQRLTVGELGEDTPLHCAIQLVRPAALKGLTAFDRSGAARWQIAVRIAAPAPLGSWYDALRAAASGSGSAARGVPSEAHEQVAAAGPGAVSVVGGETVCAWQWTGTAVELLELRDGNDAAPDGRAPSRAQSRWFDLYEAEREPDPHVLGACAPIYRHFARKRGDMLAEARTLGAGTPLSGALVTDESAVAADGLEPVRRWLARTRSDSVILDLSPHVRQVVVAKSELLDLVTDVCGARPRGPVRTSIVMREFLTGDYGAIAYADVAARRVAVEFCREGLLALNRGHGTSRTLVMEAREVRDADLPRAIREAFGVVYSATLALSEHWPDRQFEWVLGGRDAYVVDWSIRRAPLPLEPCESVTRVIYAGFASGPILHVADDPEITDLSIAPIVSIDSIRAGEHEVVRNLLQAARSYPRPPVVFARRPYAILAVLLHDVAGFVFEEGGVYSHLAVLVREAGLPSLVLGKALPAGTVARIDRTQLTVSSEPLPAGAVDRHHNPGGRVASGGGA